MNTDEYATVLLKLDNAGCCVGVVTLVDNAFQGATAKVLVIIDALADTRWRKRLGAVGECGLVDARRTASCDNVITSMVVEQLGNLHGRLNDVAGVPVGVDAVAVVVAVWTSIISI
jgi:hypothetical protein